MHPKCSRCVEPLLSPNIEKDEWRHLVWRPFLHSSGFWSLFPLVCLRACRRWREDLMLCFRATHPFHRKDSCSVLSHSLNGRVLWKRRIKGSRNYMCGSKRRALKWKMPASRIVEQNGKINIYFSAEEKMSSVLECDRKFISTPPGGNSGGGGRVLKRRKNLQAF